MADSGYPGTPLAKKIGIRPGHRVRLLHAPDGWEIPGLPGGTTAADAPGAVAPDPDVTLPDAGAALPGADAAAPGADAGAPDVTVAFFRSHAGLAAEAEALTAALADHAMLWIAWPRRAAGHESDITENALRDLFLPLGIVDVKVAALGEDWSGLKFMRRRENRRR
jgi:hypothetical protein